MATSKTINITNNKVLNYTVSKTGYKTIIGSKLITNNDNININLIESTSATSQYNVGDRLGGIASFVCYFTDGNNQKYAVFVLDAQYRTGNTRWRTNNTDTGLPNYANSTTVLAAKESATYNTNYILDNYTASSCPAFVCCRMTTIKVGDNFYSPQLPNAYELQQIWTNRINLDTFDPTLTNYSSNSLTTWNIGGNSNSHAWSSNECDHGNAWRLDSSGNWNSHSTWAYSSGIIPVFEIPVDE